MKPHARLLRRTALGRIRRFRSSDPTAAASGRDPAFRPTDHRSTAPLGTPCVKLGVDTFISVPICASLAFGIGNRLRKGIAQAIALQEIAQVASGRLPPSRILQRLGSVGSTGVVASTMSAMRTSSAVNVTNEGGNRTLRISAHRVPGVRPVRGAAAASGRRRTLATAAPGGTYRRQA